LPELDACLVYVPRPPRLLRLNMTAWLVLELCDGLDFDGLVDAYREVAGDRATAEQAIEQVRQGLTILSDARLVSVPQPQA